MATAEGIEGVERRALLAGMWANVFMGIAGVVAAWLSNSNALLLDGLFSLIGVFSAMAAARISGTSRLGPDRERPLGYGADEAIYQTFRALSLLGLVLYGVTSSALSIGEYFTGATERVLNIDVILIYSAVICLTCFGLWFLFRRAWIRSGRTSAILRIEMTSAFFDGAVTAAVGLVLSMGPLLLRTPFAPIEPVLDYVVVIVLCLVSLLLYWGEFRDGVIELAGVTAEPEMILKVRRAVRPEVEAIDAWITDLSLVKLGRRYQMVVFVDAERPFSAAEMDALRAAVKGRLYPITGGLDCVVVPSEHGRALPPHMLPEALRGEAG